MMIPAQVNEYLTELDQTQGWPRVESINQISSEPEEIQLRLSVPPDLGAFAGHFPSQAVVPGILQIHWAAVLAEICFSFKPSFKDQFSALRGIKFNAMVLPDAQLTLTMKVQANKLTFSYNAAQAKHSSGTLLFDQEAS